MFLFIVIKFLLISECPTEYQFDVLPDTCNEACCDKYDTQNNTVQWESDSYMTARETEKLTL